MRRLYHIAALTLVTSATAFAQQGIPAAATAPASSPAEVTDASRAAAKEVAEYINDHMDELKPKMAAMGVQRPATPADLDKLRTLLPADLVPKFDLARPALLEMAAKSRSAMIGMNLKRIGSMLAGIDDIDPAAPKREGKPVSTLGELVLRTEDMRYFVAPETVVPENILKGTRVQQAAWVNANTIYKLIATGKTLDSLPPDAMVAVERPDLDPSKPELLVLMGDGRVEMIDRAKVEAAIKPK